jgi:hypothetical protein
MSIPTLTVPDEALLFQWLRELIEAQLPDGQKCGDHRAEPTYDSAGKPIFPMSVLHVIPGGSVSGPPLGAAQADATFMFQADAVGRTTVQALSLAARHRHWIAGRERGGEFAIVTAVPGGLAVHDRILEGSPGAPLIEGSPPNEVYTVSDIFSVSVSVI